jgi:integrase
MRGGTRRHGKGWGWFFSAPDPTTGKRRFYSKNGFPTKKAAQEALSAELARFHKGAFVEPSKLTVQAFLLEQWFPAIEGRLRRSTRANYVTNLKVHVIPALGALKLQRLTAPRIAAFYSELLTGGRRDGKGLAPKTVRNIHALLHRALKDAARWGYVPHNRADDVDAPQGASPQRQVWTPEQLRAFLAHVREDRLYALWLLVATTGMRRAELAGLRWSDIDFARARLTPRLPRVVVNYQVHESDTKTASGRRSLSLDAATLEALRDHRRRQAEERAVAEIGDDNDLLFTWPDGRPLHPGSSATPGESCGTRTAARRSACPRSGSTTSATAMRPRRWPLASRPRSSASGSGTPTSRSPSTPIVTSSRAWTSRRRRPSPGSSWRARTPARRASRAAMLPILLPNGRRPPPWRGGEGRSPW